MTKKVTLPREVAEAIESLREEGWSAWGILQQTSGAIYMGPSKVLRDWSFESEGGGSPNELMSALVNGYEIEKSPEEKLREYYEANERMESWSGQDGHDARLTLDVIEETLDLLGIKIEGINA